MPAHTQRRSVHLSWLHSRPPANAFLLRPSGLQLAVHFLKGFLSPESIHGRGPVRPIAKPFEFHQRRDKGQPPVRANEHPLWGFRQISARTPPPAVTAR